MFGKDGTFERSVGNTGTSRYLDVLEAFVPFDVVVQIVLAKRSVTDVIAVALIEIMGTFFVRIDFVSARISAFDFIVFQSSMSCVVLGVDKQNEAGNQNTEPHGHDQKMNRER